MAGAAARSVSAQIRFREKTPRARRRERRSEVAMNAALGGTALLGTRLARFFFARYFWNEPLPGTQVSTRIKGRVQCRDALARSRLTPEANRRITRRAAPEQDRRSRIEESRCFFTAPETCRFTVGFGIRWKSM